MVFPTLTFPSDHGLIACSLGAAGDAATKVSAAAATATAAAPSSYGLPPTERAAGEPSAQPNLWFLPSWLRECGGLRPSGN